MNLLQKYLLDNWLNQDNYLIISYPKANKLTDVFRANLLALGFQS